MAKYPASGKSTSFISMQAGMSPAWRLKDRGSHMAPMLVVVSISFYMWNGIWGADALVSVEP